MSVVQPSSSPLRPLNDFALTSDTLMFGLNFQHTMQVKTGFINKLKGNEQAMDIDLSCVMFDAGLNVVDTVWFKQLRDTSQAVRHYGDSLDGKDRSDLAQVDRHVDVETIEVRLRDLPDSIAHMAFIVSSYHGQHLNQLRRGHVSFADDEGNSIHELDLTRLQSDSAALFVALLSRRALPSHSSRGKANTARLTLWDCCLPIQPLSEYRLPKMTDDISKVISNALRVS